VVVALRSSSARNPVRNLCLLMMRMEVGESEGMDLNC
jgi:hypothetical protein